MQQQRQGKPLPLLVLKAEIQSTILDITEHLVVSSSLYKEIYMLYTKTKKFMNTFYRGTFHTDITLWN